MARAVTAFGIPLFQLSSGANRTPLTQLPRRGWPVASATSALRSDQALRKRHCL